MSDELVHGEPGVIYEPPPYRPGDAIISQMPSVALIEASGELEALFWEEVLATELWNTIRHEPRTVVLGLVALYREMRSIDPRDGDEAKADYAAAKAAVAEETTRLIGTGGVMRALRKEVDAAKDAMHEVRDERLTLQRDVRIELRNARLRR